MLSATHDIPESADVLPPVGLEHMRAHCPDCGADVPAERHCLWAETGESWAICSVCSGDVDVTWPGA